MCNSLVGGQGAVMAIIAAHISVLLVDTVQFLYQTMSQKCTSNTAPNVLCSPMLIEEMIGEVYSASECSEQEIRKMAKGY